MLAMSLGVAVSHTTILKVNFIIFILLMKKLRLRDVKQLTHGHTDGEWWD